MTAKPTYEELEKRVQELEKLESEHEHFRKALQESENLFKLLYEKAPLGYQSLDENGHFLIVNQTWLDTLGYTREEVIGKSFADFLHPDWQDHFKENFPRFKSIGEVLGVEFEMVKKNGDLILVSFSGKIGRDNKGNFQQTHCIFHDITERRKYEDLLERYKNIVSSTTDAIAYLDNNYRYIIVNNAYEDFSGTKGDDFVGITVAEYLGKDIFETKIKPNLDRCLSGEIVNYQEWFEYPTKGKRFVDVTYFPYRDGENHISGVIASTRDITGRQQTENDLERVRHSIENLTESVFWVGDDGTLIDFNAAACERLGYSREEMLTMHVSDLDPHFPQERWPVHWEEMKCHGTMIFETVHRTKNGRLIPMELVVHNQRFGDTRYNCVLGRDITERKLAEEKLRKSEELLNSIQRLTHIGGWEWDIERQTMTWTDETYRIHGMAPGELAAGTPEHINASLACYDPADRRAIKAAFRFCATDGQPYDLEFPLTRVDGSRIWIRTMAYTVKQDGQVIRVIGNIMDITDRKQAEQKLKESEERFRTLMENIDTVAVQGYGPDGTTQYWNKASERLYGYTRQEAVGRNLIDLIIPSEIKDDVAEAIGEMAESGKPIPSGELLLMHKDGSRVPVISHHAIVKVPGCEQELFCLDVDITERKRIERELLFKENIIKSSSCAITTCDLEGNMTYGNPFFQKLWGVDGSGDYLGKPFRDFWLIGDQDEDIVSALQSEGTWAGELKGIKKDGRLFDVQVSAATVLDDTGNAIARTSTSIDITERKTTEAKLRQFQKAESLGRMAGAIAHHLNNQLSVVIGNLELALDDLSDNAKIRGNLLQSMTAAQKATEVSRQMLIYLGQASGKHELIDFAEVCRQNLYLLQAVIPKGININIDFPYPGPVIRADKGQINQVLNNLVTNAWESISNEQGSIHLVIRTVSQVDIRTSRGFPIDWQPKNVPYACLEVSDTGCGITNVDIGKLFDPFFTTKFTGRGMGLPVVMGMVKALGGCIIVDSQSGCGTTFRIYLPVSTETVPRQPEKAVMADARKSQNKGTVLLIEDEEMVRNMAKTMLTRFGYTVIEAQDGVEAVKLFQQHQKEICCVLSDLTMPRMGGWETLSALRKIRADLPVILASGHNKDLVMAGNHPELPQAFLYKPYSISALKEALSKAMGV